MVDVVLRAGELVEGRLRVSTLSRARSRDENRFLLAPYNDFNVVVSGTSLATVVDAAVVEVTLDALSVLLLTGDVIVSIGAFVMVVG